jgi:membrane protease YdiL (CAAX protease family)
MAASAASLFAGFTLLRSALAGFVLYYLASCLALPAIDLLLLRRIEPRRVPELLGIKRPGPRELALGLGSGLAMAALTLAFLIFFKSSIFGDGRIAAVLAGWGASGENAVLVYIVMLAFNGALEELFWRGYLYDRLRSTPNRALALGLPALFFGAQHVFVVSALIADPALLALVLFGILGAGIVWSLLRERVGGVLPCAISHMLVTAGYMGALLFLGR